MLIAKRLRKRLGARLVLRDVSFQVEAGVACAVVGRNGAGKSTLLRVVSQVLRADSGRVTWRAEWGEGLPSSHFEGDELRALCGENLEFWARVRGLRFEPDFLRAHLKAWQLGSRWNEPAAALSSGLRARLGLAVATLGEPKILLLDEPGANLDEPGRELLRDLLDKQRRRGVALVASNEPREIALCDRSIEL